MTHLVQLEISCPQCQRTQTLSLTNDIPPDQSITCSACHTEIAKVGDFLSRVSASQSWMGERRSGMAESKRE